MDSEQLKKIGNRSLAARDYSGAESAFREAVLLDPSFTPGWRGLIKTLHRHNRYEEAATIGASCAARLDSDQIWHLYADSCRVLALRGVSHYTDPALRAYETANSRRPAELT